MTTDDFATRRELDALARLQDERHSRLVSDIGEIKRGQASAASRLDNLASLPARVDTIEVRIGEMRTDNARLFSEAKGDAQAQFSEVKDLIRSHDVVATEDTRWSRALWVSIASVLVALATLITVIIVHAG